MMRHWSPPPTPIEIHRALFLTAQRIITRHMLPVDPRKPDNDN
jgi:hypothetical protein